MKKKNKPVWKKITDPVYRTVVVFITNANWEEANKILTRLGVAPMPEDLKTCKGAVQDFDESEFPKVIKGTVFFIWVADKKDICCLLHETTHLVIKIFKWRCQSIVDEASEATAYYMEYWFKTLWEIMSK